MSNGTQSQTLLGLLPQLKNMEDNIVAMIMEMSTKLADLTDANVFVLVELPNQRKFSGSQHLVEQYLNGGIVTDGRGQDIELEVSFAPVVVPKSNNHRRYGKVHPPGTELVPYLVNRKRSGENAYAANREPPKRKKSKTNAKTASTSLPTTSAIATKTIVAKPRNDESTSNLTLDLKAEAFYDGEVDLTLEEDSMYDVDVGQNFENDSYFPFPDDNRDYSSSSASGQYLPSIMRIHGPTDESKQHQPPSVIRFQDTNQMLVRMDDLNLPQQKLDFLQSVQDTEKAFVKGSPDTKIITSLMYDFGKSLHAAFTQYVTANPTEDPLLLVKPFLNANLDAFLEQFPNLRLETYHNIRIENRKPKAFMKRHTENSFHRCMRESLKGINNPNPQSLDQFDQDNQLMGDVHSIPQFHVQTADVMTQI